MNEILTVSQLNDRLKLLLEESFESVWVEGEVSNLRRPQSGHIYFTLKDDKSQIRAVFFRPYNFYERKNSFELEEGLKVLCRSRLNVYLPRGEYQLIVESFEPLGIGALQKAFEQLKAKLFAEGLFDERHKKRLPFLPERIGVITSPSGAVIRDILNITRRRFPAVDILIAPVRVQGREAASEIIQALRNLHAVKKVDVIILARGGGSLEDIAPFNEEALAREIHRSTIPIISAVGHETDFTICDFVADMRAPTPSAAAELVVPDRSEWMSKLYTFRQRIISGMKRHLDDYREEIRDFQERLKSPRRYVINLKMNLDDLRERLGHAFHRKTQHLFTELKHLQWRLYHQSPPETVLEKKISLQNLECRLTGGFTDRINELKKRLEKHAAVLDSLSPLAVLRRGYSITSTIEDGRIVRQASDVAVGQHVHIRLAQGNLEAKIQTIHQE